MMLSTSLMAALATTVVVVTATKQLQINYYSDACSSYERQVDVTWATKLYGGKGNCYNYHYGNSLNVANCNEGTCLCNFYSGENCQGSVYQAYDGTCVGDAQGVHSFACYYY